MNPSQKTLYDPIKEFSVGENRWQGNSVKDVTWQVLNGDSRNVLSQFPDSNFDCVVTSPPYYSLRDYGVENQIGLEQTVTEYVDAISSVMSDVYRVLKPTGLLFLNLGDT